jgi:protein-S-isoprenylcysteine O-methyltransferase Ste14
MRLPVPWVFVLAYLVGVLLERVAPLPLHVTPLPGLLLAGAALLAAGAIIAGWAWVLFHKVGTTRVPGQASVSLVTSGPFRLSRNPMYVGLALAYLGEAFVLRQSWPVTLLPFVLAYLNGVVIRVEEARLGEVFCEAYESYRSNVRRWI